VNYYNNSLSRRDNWKFPPKIQGATYSHYVVLVPNKEKIIDEYASKGEHLGELIQYVVPLLNCYKKDSNQIDYPNALKASKEAINFNVTN
jgi:hypothetical protein